MQFHIVPVIFREREYAKLDLEALSTSSGKVNSAMLRKKLGYSKSPRGWRTAVSDESRAVFERVALVVAWVAIMNMER